MQDQPTGDGHSPAPPDSNRHDKFPNLVVLSDKAMSCTFDSALLLSDVKAMLKIPRVPPNGKFGADDWDWSAWKLNPICFQYLAFLVLSMTGFVLNVDMFHDAENIQIPDVLPDDTAIRLIVMWINACWSDYDVLIPRLLAIPNLKFVVLAPVKDASWSRQLECSALYVAEIPMETSTFLPKSTGYSTPVGRYHGCVRAYFVNFEFGTGGSGLHQHSFSIPSIARCSALLDQPARRRVPRPKRSLPVVDLHLPQKKPKQVYSVKAWQKHAHRISSAHVREKVLSSLARGGC